MSNDVQKISQTSPARYMQERGIQDANQQEQSQQVIPVVDNTHDVNKGVTLQHNNAELNNEDYNQLGEYIGRADIAKLQNKDATKDDLARIKSELNRQIRELDARNAEAAQKINTLINKVEALNLALNSDQNTFTPTEVTDVSLNGASRKTLRELINAGIRENATEKDVELAKRAKIALDNTPLGYYTPNELDPVRRMMADVAVANSGSDVPLYKNEKAQEKLKEMMQNINSAIADNLDDAIEKATDPEVKAALKKYQTELRDINLSKKQAKYMANDIIIGDKVEHTIVLDSKKDVKDAKEKLGDEAEDYRIVCHSKRFKKKNAEMSGILAENKDMSTHEAAYKQLSDMGERGLRVSGDRTFEKSEVKATKYKSNSTYYSSRREAKRLGYDVDDGLAAAIAVPIALGLAGAATGAILGPVISATADAVASVTVPVLEAVGDGLYRDTGISKTTTDQSHSEKVKDLGPYSALVGGLLSAAIGAAAFGSRGEEDDILKNLDRKYLFESTNGVVNFENTKLSKEVKSVLREIDKLDLTENQKAKILTDAAGSGTPNKLSPKELVNALVNAKLGIGNTDDSSEEKVPCPDEEVVEDLRKENEKLKKQIEEIGKPRNDDGISSKKKPTYIPRYVTEDLAQVNTRTIPTIQYAGPYHYSKFYVVDGQPVKFNSPEYKALINRLNNGDMMEANYRKDRVLTEEIDLGNGKVAKLVSDQKIAEIRATLKTKGGGKDVRYKAFVASSGVTVLYKIEKKADGTEVKKEIRRGDKATMEAERDRLNREAKEENCID